jgi:NitT/TauT family transport system ATP-binding protein
VEEAVYMAERVVVLSPGPGLIAASFDIGGPFPRPPGYRVTEPFRRAAEQVSAALEAAMKGAAA